MFARIWDDANGWQHTVTGELKKNYLTKDVKFSFKDDFQQPTLEPLVKLKVRGVHSIFDCGYGTLHIYNIDLPMKIKLVRVEAEPEHMIAVEDFIANYGLLTWEKTEYEYLKRKIAIAGAPSSGKTETARRITNILNVHYGCTAEHAVEYARSFINRYDVPDWRLQPFLEQGQERRENDLSMHNIVVSDGPRFLSTIYTGLYFNGELNKQTIYILHKIFKKSVTAMTEYDNIVLCMPQKLKEDGTRFQTDKEIEIIHHAAEGMLKDYNVPFVWHDVKENSPDDLVTKLFKINKPI
jgi:nicotinamide riboside kinase